MQVIKRDGSSVDYDRSKIIIAIQKANAEVEDSEKISQEKIEAIVDGIESKHRIDVYKRQAHRAVVSVKR